MISFVRRWLGQNELTPDERRSVLEDLFVFGKTNQFPYFMRQAVLLVLSTIIATAGLISDSAAVVIGAMLVAPLMTPVLAAAGAVVMGWPNRFYKALWVILLMAVGALVLSSLMTLISPELFIIPEQVLARTRPTFWDLIIALAAGSAGAYTITRKESSAIPGVAVAVALLPPLASTGILFTTGEQELALRALVLFLTNFVAMVLSGAITFLCVGVAPIASRARSAGFVRQQLFLFFLLTLAVSAPLWIYSERVIFNADYQAARSEVLQGWLARHDFELQDIEIFREERRVVLSLAGPQPPTGTVQELHDELVTQHQLESLSEEDPEFKIDYVWTQKITGTWPSEETTAAQAAVDLNALASKAVGWKWQWVKTDFSDGRTTAPGKGEDYRLLFNDRGRVEINAECGKLRGSVTVTRQTLAIEFTTARNIFRMACRNDDALNVFATDLESARQMEIQDKTLRMLLRDGTGVITLRRP